MGLLDQVIGGVLGSRARGGGGGMSPIAMALLALLASRAMGQGGLGGLLGGLVGGGAAPDPRAAPAPEQGYPRHGGGGADDFAGMLDGPGGAPGRTADSGFTTGGYAGADTGGGLGGGLGDLIGRFQQGGLGDVIGSWIGHGPNRDVSPHQLEQALGDRTVDDLQRQTGMPRGDLLSELARVLPGVVDQLTPQGRAPSRDEMRHW